MLLAKRAATAVTLAFAGATLVACQTTEAPLERIEGVAVELSETQFEMVKATIRESLWEPTGAYFTPNVGALQVGNIIAVCGILNGTNPYNVVNDALYLVYLHLDGGLRGEMIDIGGPRDINRDIRERCFEQFGIVLAE